MTWLFRGKPCIDSAVSAAWSCSPRLLFPLWRGWILSLQSRSEPLECLYRRRILARSATAAFRISVLRFPRSALRSVGTGRAEWLCVGREWTSFCFEVPSVLFSEPSIESMGQIL